MLLFMDGVRNAREEGQWSSHRAIVTMATITLSATRILVRGRCSHHVSSLGRFVFPVIVIHGYAAIVKCNLNVASSSLDIKREAETTRAHPKIAKMARSPPFIYITNPIIHWRLVNYKISCIKQVFDHIYL